MPIVNRFADLSDEITEWRRDIHANPELLYDVHRTAALVEEKLKAFGLDEVVPGIGKTGVVGIIKGKSNASGKVIGLRADMDALPIEEVTGKPYASTVPGKMHACGHDGHTAMLLGAAKYLSETRNFDGTVVVIFQPAEEGGAGAKAMIDDGLMTRFGIQEVYGMHNMPGAPVGTFAIRPGPLMAAADRLNIEVEGKGCHAAKPHEGIDTILVASQIINSLQSIASRNADPLESVVVSITMFNAGFTDNVIPQTATLRGTVRTLTPEMRDMAEERVKRIATSVAEAYGATATVNYRRDYPVTVNNAEKMEFAASIAAQIVGEENVELNVPPTMGGEDFAFMLEERPGAFIFAGNGDSAMLHHPAYDFNDELIPVGCSYWVKLVETALAAK
ncbi:amidohydrolase [Stappia sp. GBMRC 2046]|uniref:Amidohydrolase n=1 Tax=Stappia sediminis TaxID=2692190 RepID=A0A7X3S7M0_9HYPH|nr:M20 aminoacylase family protein [Stappia sediminis]MXN64874.1 amidohydrolase [Stappia sediminis]